MARLHPETHDAVAEGAAQSAAVLLPLIAASHLNGAPSGLLDVGAGRGHWLQAAHALWPEAAMLGLDLDEDESRFPIIRHWDAEAGVELPLRAGPHVTETRIIEGEEYPATAYSRWPLVLCLEMAEHVSIAAGEHLVSELCRVAERVVWSAAIPDQGGDGHVNERAPTYWNHHFNQRGWFLSDPWRMTLWRDERIEPWYRQNLLLATPAATSEDGGPVATIPPRHLVHPAVFRAKAELALQWRQSYLDLSELHEQSIAP